MTRVVGYFEFRTCLVWCDNCVMEPELLESLWLNGKDGAQYRAHIFQERINASALSPGSWLVGEKRYRLEDGTPLKFVDESTFVNAVTGERLHRRTKPS